MTARKRKLFTSLLLLVVLGGGAWQVLRPRVPDPIYEGKPLSYWINGYRTYPYRSRLKWADADAAVWHAGTNAIPLLLGYLRAHDSPLKRKLMALAAKQPFIDSPFVTDHERHDQAFMGFIALGASLSKLAVPELMRIYEQDQSVDLRICVLHLFTVIGPEDRRAMPLLIRETASQDKEICYAALAAALNTFGNKPDLIMPVLIKSLNDSSNLVQTIAIEGLKLLGPRAKEAVPRLIELRQSLTLKPDSRMKEDIDKALQNIDPAAAARVGIDVTNASPAQ